MTSQGSSIPAATYAYTSLSLLPKPAYSPPVPRPPPPPKHAAIAPSCLSLKSRDAPPSSSRSADSVDVCVVVKTGPIGSLYPDSRSTAQRGGAGGLGAGLGASVGTPFVGVRFHP